MANAKRTPRLLARAEHRLATCYPEAYARFTTGWKTLASTAHRPVVVADRATQFSGDW